MCHIQLCIDPRFSSIQKMSCHLRKHASVFSLKTEAKQNLELRARPCQAPRLAPPLGCAPPFSWNVQRWVTTERNPMCFPFVKSARVEALSAVRGCDCVALTHQLHFWPPLHHSSTGRTETMALQLEPSASARADLLLIGYNSS